VDKHEINEPEQRGIEETSSPTREQPSEGQKRAADARRDELRIKRELRRRRERGKAAQLPEWLIES
jgi:hypothetical protein